LHVIDKVLVVKHEAPGATLDICSIVCLEDKTFVGKINETIGPCKSPYYTIILSNLFNVIIDKETKDNVNFKIEDNNLSNNDHTIIKKRNL